MTPALGITGDVRASAELAQVDLVRVASHPRPVVHQGAGMRVAVDADARHERDELDRHLAEPVPVVAADSDKPRARHGFILHAQAHRKTCRRPSLRAASCTATVSRIVSKAGSSGAGRSATCIAGSVTATGCHQIPDAVTVGSGASVSTVTSSPPVATP